MEVDIGAVPFTLIVVSALISGAASVAFIKRFADLGGMRKAVNRIVACLLEFRLFADEPSVVLKAQWNLLAANARLMRLMALPALALIAPYWLLLAAADGFFAHAPLTPGEPSVVTLRCRGSEDVRTAIVTLEAPAGVTVDTAPVRIPVDSEICWRIRAQEPVSGRLAVHYNGRLLTKTVSSSRGLESLSDLRAGSVWLFLLHPEELPFSDPAIASIRVAYPKATVFELPWLFWFCAASFVGAIAGATMC